MVCSEAEVRVRWMAFQFDTLDTLIDHHSRYEAPRWRGYFFGEADMRERA